MCVHVRSSLITSSPKSGDAHVDDVQRHLELVTCCEWSPFPGGPGGCVERFGYHLPPLGEDGCRVCPGMTPDCITRAKASSENTLWLPLRQAGVGNKINKTHLMEDKSIALSPVKKLPDLTAGK